MKLNILGHSKGLLIVISAPSGGGKTTLTNQLKRVLPEIEYSISATTRPPRPQEKNGVDYHFISEKKFREKVKRNEFVETALVHGYLYGTPKDALQKKLADGKDILLDIDVQGGRQIKKIFPESVIVFIAPPSLVVLEERLRNRKQDDEKTIQKRLKNAIREITQAVNYDYIIMNKDLEQAVNHLKSIVISEKLKMNRNRDLLKMVLKECGKI